MCQKKSDYVKHFFLDQMDYLNDCKVVTKSLNSKMKGKERKEVIDDILSDSPRTKMLYVTPEQVCIYSF